MDIDHAVLERRVYDRARARLRVAVAAATHEQIAAAAALPVRNAIALLLSETARVASVADR